MARDYHAEYEARRQRAAERGFESFYAERTAGPAAREFADAIAAGTLSSDTAGYLMDAGVGAPSDLVSASFDIDTDGYITVEFVDENGDVVVVSVDPDEAWDELWEWLADYGIEPDVTYEEK